MNNLISRLFALFGYYKPKPWKAPHYIDYGLTPPISFKVENSGTEHESLFVRTKDVWFSIPRKDLERGWKK